MDPATLAMIIRLGFFGLQLAQQARALQGEDGPLTPEEIDAVVDETIRASRARALLRADGMDAALAARRAALTAGNEGA